MYRPDHLNLLASAASAGSPSAWDRFKTVALLASVLAFGVTATRVEAREPARIDVPGFAEITQPAEGQAVDGIVTIQGTATHPAFRAFDLAFSFDPDPTETWFPLGEPIDTPVVDGRLAIWDTGPISDGNYRLRLRVLIDGGEPLVAIIRDLRVRNYTPTEAPSGAAPIAATSAPEPTPALEVEQTDAPAQTRPDLFSPALTIGVVGGVALLVFLGAYQLVVPRARAYAGFLRMRQMHKRADRTRRR